MSNRLPLRNDIRVEDPGDPVGDVSRPSDDCAVTVDRENYSVSYYPNRIVLTGTRSGIREEASRIISKFSYSAQPYEVQSETANSIVIVPSATSVRL